MNIHYTIVINKREENQRVQMGQKFKKLLKGGKNKKKKKKKKGEKKTDTASDNTT